VYAHAANAYRRVDLESAPKTQILDQLFARLLADLDAGKAAIAERDIKRKHAALDHAMQIVTELRAALDVAAAPELCGHLAALYDFAMNRIGQAGARLDGRFLDEVIQVICPLREAFAQAAAK
jgi:flagellar protein FliS